MSERHHPPEHLGEECPKCGVVHRVLESLPDKPLSQSAIQSIEESENFAYARGIAVHSDGSDEGMVTDDLVLSSPASTLLLSRYPGTGWVVEQEIEHQPEDDPREVGAEVRETASQHLAGAISELAEEEFDA